MASNPFRRRRGAGSTVRDLAIAEAAIALAGDRLGGSRRRGHKGRNLLFGGAAVAIAAGALWKRDKVAGLLPSRGQTYEPPAPAPPGPSNYDAPGPVANTATPVPAPDPQQPQPVDELAEEAAAAAEAANIGGAVSDYAGPSGEPATEAERPLAEAGEGEAEGQEQAELDLERAAEPTAPGVSDAERSIDDAIEQAANPLAGEQVEPTAPTEKSEPGEDSGWSPPDAEAADEPAPLEPPAEDDSKEPAEFEPPSADQPEAGEEKQNEEGGTDWRTWSGRSLNQ
jgi:hypothetical protein